MNVSPRKMHTSMYTSTVQEAAFPLIPGTPKMTVMAKMRKIQEQYMIIAEYFESLRGLILTFLMLNARIRPITWRIAL